MMTCNEVPVAVATWLSKGENLDLIYTNPKNHIVCFIPTYEPGGGDSTMCYFVDGRQELVHLPIRHPTRAGLTRRVETKLHHDQRWSAQ